MHNNWIWGLFALWSFTAMALSGRYLERERERKEK